MIQLIFAVQLLDVTFTQKQNNQLDRIELYKPVFCDVEDCEPLPSFLRAEFDHLEVTFEVLLSDHSVLSRGSQDVKVAAHSGEDFRQLQL